VRPTPHPGIKRNVSRCARAAGSATLGRANLACPVARPDVADDLRGSVAPCCARDYDPGSKASTTPTLTPVEGRVMSFYRGVTCENVTLNGDKGTPISAHVAKPSGPGSFPGGKLVHHLPGWSEFYMETTSSVRVSRLSRDLR
jgi:hypothetical protein